MTNEQKAMQLANEYKNYTNINAIHLHLEGKTKDEVVEQCVYAAAIEMAAWKDEQVKQIQEREIKACNEYIERHPDNKLMLKYHLGRLSLCDELLGTDSRDKINMAFATID